MGCDTFNPIGSNMFGVSIHAPTWGATGLHQLPKYVIQSFNPRTHMGCDLPNNLHDGYTQGFNPRTHMGCDILTSSAMFILDSFNPRTHMGCDIYVSRYHHGMMVSIHAPTWGATLLQIINSLTTRVSIHAPTWGATHTTGGTSWYLMFQSTHPHGVRLTKYADFLAQQKFQSTHPHGVRRY